MKEIIFDKNRYHEVQSMKIWCNEQFGPPHEDTWIWSSIFGKTYFTFNDERQYNWFVMRWS